MPVNELNGRAIKIGRAFKGMSQRQLALATGLKIHRIFSIENDVKPPRPAELAKILRALTTSE